MFSQNEIFVMTLSALVLLFIARTWKSAPKRKPTRAEVVKAINKLLDEE
jgi:hypothetical protein